MSLNDEHEARFGRPGDTVADQHTRDHADRMVKLVAELRERLMLEAQTAAEQIRAAHPELIDLYEHSTRRNSASHEEQIAGFVQKLSDDWGDLIDSDELERLQHIVDTGFET